MSATTVDVDLIRLTKGVQAKLKALSMDPNSRESAFLVAKEEFTDGMAEALKEALSRLTPEQKVEAFDRIAHEQIEGRIKQVRAQLAGDYYQDEDDTHYLGEEITKAVFGPKCYDAFNELETIYAAKPRGKE